MQELQELKCPICFDRYNETTNCPTLVGCDHTICLLCYKGAIGPGTMNCPLCRAGVPFQGSYKRNIPLLDMVRKHLIHGECSQHENMPLKFLCLEDKKQICEECLTNGDHKGHRVSTLKSELEKKVRLYQEKEDVLIQYEKKAKSLLEARKHEDLVSQSQMLDEFESLIKKRKLEAISQVLLSHEHQRKMLSSSFGKQSKARLLLRQKVKEYTGKGETSDILEIMNEDIDQKPLKFNKDAAGQCINEFSKISDQVYYSLATSLNDQIRKLSSIKFSQQGLMLGDHSMSGKITSNLRFTGHNDTLIIELCLKENRDYRLEVEAWKDMKHVEFWFSRLVFHENDLDVLEYIMSKLTKAQSIKIVQTHEDLSNADEVFSFDKNWVSQTNKLLRILITEQKGLRDLQVKLDNPEQGATIIASLAKDILPNIKTKALNKFMLLFLTTCPVKGLLEDLIQSLILFDETLENVSLKLPGTVLDYDLLGTQPLILPRLTDFKLQVDCGGEPETKEKVHNFIRSSLKPMKNLKTLHLSLYNHGNQMQNIATVFAQLEEMTTLRDLSFIIDPLVFQHNILLNPNKRSPSMNVILDALKKSIFKMDFLSNLCIGYGDKSINGLQQI